MSNMYDRGTKARIEDLQGKVLTAVHVEDEEIRFACNDGTAYIMMHDNVCCEDVRVEEVIGDIAGLIGSPLLMAYEASSEAEVDHFQHQTWTFYTLATVKATVVIRWLGESNGYYSERVDLIRAHN